MDKDKVKETVRQRFTEYLTVKGCRKTPERYAILDAIYSRSGHFNMEGLYDVLKKDNFRVSRATLYNTMQLLLDCHLVFKHQFGNNLSFYEKAFNNNFHHHLICTVCGNVEECKDVNLGDFVNNRKIKHFIPSYFSLYIYGVCGKCNHANKKRNTN